MRTPLIAGNWKMHKTIGDAVDLAEALLHGLGDAHDREVLICPPYTALHAALGHGLRGILCVGETKPQRDSGAAESVVISQLHTGLADVGPASLDDLVIAYEPVWAIGTGDTATPADAQAMHATIRRTLA